MKLFSRATARGIAGRVRTPLRAAKRSRSAYRRAGDCPPYLGKMGCGRNASLPNPRARGFTLLEIMIAMFIFSMVLTAIYSIWICVLKGRKAVETTLAEVQRSRIAMHALEDAFLTVQMYNENALHYAFSADTTGDDAFVSMVARLPSSYPGVGRYAGGELVVRRVSFYTEQGDKGKDLVMTQAPMLLATNHGGAKPYSLILAHDVSEFRLKFYDLQNNEWVDEWLYTNKLPRLVHITLGLGKKGSSSDSHDLASRIVSIPATAIETIAPPGMRPGMPGMPGYPQPGGYGQPGVGTGSRTLPSFRGQ